MKTYSLFSLVFLLICPMVFGQQIPEPEWQIKTALMAVPMDYREDASVLGYAKNGELTTLKKGTNAYIALANNPSNKGFSTASYHKDLDPFMARGRALRAEGHSNDEVFAIREAEVKSGKLAMPDKATLCIFMGKVNPETGEIEDPYTRYVFYIPFATGESTGLPTTPTPPGHAWLMDPGTHKAHIMITPPRN